MSETTAKRVNGSQPKQHNKRSSEYSFRDLLSFGPYRIDHLTQDEAIAYFPKGNIHGIWRPGGDSQSDPKDPSIQLITKELRDILVPLVKQRVEEKINRDRESDESFAVEEPVRPVSVEEQVSGQAVDTVTDDFLQWTSDHLYSAILDADSESDMPRLREIILVAEDAGFTVAQSEQLAPWLLSFAERRRDSSDPHNEAAVWSAIRTGASMLTPHDVDNLRPLLEPGHSIETSLVTVKMLGRIFEAQPPAEIDEHRDLADEVCQIAESLLNRYAITVSQSAAMAQLAIYALAAMASSETQRFVETIQQLGVTWFTQQTLRELRELRNIWASRPVPVAERPRELLTKALQTLGRD